MAKQFEETRYWCEYCRIFVYNNRINREKHDSSPQHQANFKKKVETLRKEEREREKMNPKPVQSAKTESFYNKPVSAKVVKETAPVHLLNVKSQSTGVKKQVLGLASTPKTKPETTPTFEPEQTANDFAVDIKSTTSDLKRMIAEDEITLLTESSTKPDSSSQEPSVEVHLSSMFKKKKK